MATQITQYKHSETFLQLYRIAKPDPALKEEDISHLIYLLSIEHYSVFPI